MITHFVLEAGVKPAARDVWVRPQSGTISDTTVRKMLGHRRDTIILPASVPASTTVTAPGPSGSTSVEHVEPTPSVPPVTSSPPTIPGSDIPAEAVSAGPSTSHPALPGSDRKLLELSLYLLRQIWTA